MYDINFTYLIRSSPLPLKFSLLLRSKHETYVCFWLSYCPDTLNKKKQLCDFLLDLLQENSNGNGADLTRNVKVFNTHRL